MAGGEYLRILNCGEDGGGRSLLNWPRAVLKFESFSHSMALGQLPDGSAEQPTQGCHQGAFSILTEMKGKHLGVLREGLRFAQAQLGLGTHEEQSREHTGDAQVTS